MIFEALKTIRIQFLAICLLFTSITVFVSIYCFLIYQKRDKSAELRNIVHNTSSEILLINKLQIQFILYDSKNDLFYLTKKSNYIKKYKKLFYTINNNLRILKNDKAVPEEYLIKLEKELEDYKKDYEKLISKIQERGFRDYGLEGKMRRYIHEVESHKNSIDMVLLLTIRRNEKDYILRKDSSYIINHINNTDLLRKKIISKRISINEKKELELLLNKYQQCFSQWVLIDKEIGTDQGGGLTEKLKKHNEAFENIISEVIKYSDNNDKELSSHGKLIFITGITISIILSFILSFLFSASFTRPISQLSNSMTEIVENNFSSSIVHPLSKSKSEMGTLINNFNWMVSKIHSYIEKIKMNEKVLNAKEQQFRAMIENGSDAIVLTDIKGKITYASPSTFRIIGYYPEELMGMSINKLIHPRDAENLNNQFDEALSSPGKIISIQLRILHKDKQWRWIDGCTCNLLFEPSIEAIITNYRDITNRKNDELKIEEQYKELQKINSELDKFVYSASHDLKAPLTSILGIINVAKMEPDMASKIKYLYMTEANVKKLIGIIRDLTDFSRNARIEILKEKINFSEIIEESLSFYNHLENFNKINFKIKIEVNQDFYSDSVRIKIMLNNLISNAIIYHNINQEDPFILISVKYNSSKLEIIVKDNGQGISEEFHSKIFDMFYRASEDSRGSGLGLFIVKEILEKLKGEISFLSSPGIGTEFSIKLLSA